MSSLKSKKNHWWTRVSGKSRENVASARGILIHLDAVSQCVIFCYTKPFFLLPSKRISQDMFY